MPSESNRVMLFAERSMVNIDAGERVLFKGVIIKSFLRALKQVRDYMPTGNTLQCCTEIQHKRLTELRTNYICNGYG